MARKNQCVECRHCETRVDPKKGVRHYCARKKRALPAGIFPRPSCERFELPEMSGHWGP